MSKIQKLLWNEAKTFLFFVQNSPESEKISRCEQPTYFCNICKWEVNETQTNKQKVMTNLVQIV
jgi:hypothetical protein